MTDPVPPVVTFVADDAFGLWRQGDKADDLGWESEHPDAPPIRLLRLHQTNEVICLHAPYERGLIR